jgi:hypothetical protein
MYVCRYIVSIRPVPVPVRCGPEDPERRAASGPFCNAMPSRFVFSISCLGCCSCCLLFFFFFFFPPSTPCHPQSLNSALPPQPQVCMPRAHYQSINKSINMSVCPYCLSHESRARFCNTHTKPSTRVTHLVHQRPDAPRSRCLVMTVRPGARVT